MQHSSPEQRKLGTKVISKGGNTGSFMHLFASYLSGKNRWCRKRVNHFSCVTCALQNKTADNQSHAGRQRETHRETGRETQITYTQTRRHGPPPNILISGRDGLGMNMDLDFDAEILTDMDAKAQAWAHGALQHTTQHLQCRAMVQLLVDLEF